MYLPLGNLIVRLASDSPRLLSRWKEIFGQWALETLPPGTVEDLTLDLALVETLPALPSHPPIFVDTQGIVDVYHEHGKQAFVLHFHAGAVARTDISGPCTSVEGAVTTGIFRADRLEDVTFTTLAPLLRRHQHFMLHAAAAGEVKTALFVGPSGCGKTTTGLALLLAGWRYLANDVVLLARCDEGIYAFPTPSELTVRRQTFALLPELKALTRNAHTSSAAGARKSLQIDADAWAEASRATIICFPRLAGSGNSRLRRLPAAVGLARLMEESVDRWDTQTLDAHLDLLTALGRQCRHYELALGPDVEELPGLIAGA